MGNLISRKEVINQAITELGGKALEDSFDSERSKSLEKVFLRTSSRLLSAHSWQFNLRKKQLTRLSSNPIAEWDYRYRLPTDSLSIRGHYDSKEARTELDGSRYEEQGRFLLTNEEIIFTSYEALIEPQDYPPFFDDYIVISLAEAIARTETGERSNANLSLLRSRSNQAFRDAVAADQKGRRARYRGDSDVLRARFGGRR